MKRWCRAPEREENIVGQAGNGMHFAIKPQKDQLPAIYCASQCVPWMDYHSLSKNGAGDAHIRVSRLLPSLIPLAVSRWCNKLSHSSPSVLLEFPITVVEWADLTCLEPPRDAMEVEGVLQTEVWSVSYDESQTHHAGEGPTLQIPQATVHSSLVADAWFAWHSMPVRERDGQRAAWGQRV